MPGEPFSFGPVKPGIGLTPTTRASSGWSRRAPAASRWARPSLCRMAGRTGLVSRGRGGPRRASGRRSRSPLAPERLAGANRLISAIAPAIAATPHVGILLRPAGLRTVGRIGARRACDRLAALICQERLKPGGSAVEPEIHGRDCAPRPRFHKRAPRRANTGETERPCLACRKARNRRRRRGRAPTLHGSESASSRSTAAFQNVPEAGEIGRSTPRATSPTAFQSPSRARREKRRTSRRRRRRSSGSASLRRAKRGGQSRRRWRTAARCATWGLEQVRTISRTIMGQLPFAVFGRVRMLWRANLFLNMSSLEKLFSNCQWSMFRQRNVKELSHCIVCGAA